MRLNIKNSKNRLNKNNWNNDLKEYFYLFKFKKIKYDRKLVKFLISYKLAVINKELNIWVER